MFLYLLSSIFSHSILNPYLRKKKYVNTLINRNTMECVMLNPMAENSCHRLFFDIVVCVLLLFTYLNTTTIP